MASIPQHLLLPGTDLVLVNCRYRLGNRYRYYGVVPVPCEDIRSLKQVVIGMDMVSLLPITIARELGDNAPSVITTVGRASNKYSTQLIGQNTGVRLFDIHNNEKSGGILHADLYRRGILPRLKQHINLWDESDTGTLTPPERIDESQEICRRLALKLPLFHLTRIDTTLEDSFTEQRPRLENISMEPISPYFSMPVFKLTSSFPKRALEIVQDWIRDHPYDLLYPAMALQATMIWIHINSDPKRCIEPLLEKEVPLDFTGVNLNSLLAHFHSYVLYHQHHSLAHWMHPVRFVNSVVSLSQFQDPPATPEMDRALIELQLHLKPFIKTNFLGHILPCSWPSSPVPDLLETPAHRDYSDLRYLSRGSKEWIGQSRLPDWRTLGHPTIPGWGEQAPKDLLRPLWIPRQWLDEEVLGTIYLEPAQHDRDCLMAGYGSDRPGDPDTNPPAGCVAHWRENEDMVSTILGPRLPICSASPSAAAKRIAECRNSHFRQAVEKYLGYTPTESSNQDEEIPRTPNGPLKSEPRSGSAPVASKRSMREITSSSRKRRRRNHLHDDDIFSPRRLHFDYEGGTEISPNSRGSPIPAVRCLSVEPALFLDADEGHRDMRNLLSSDVVTALAHYSQRLLSHHVAKGDIPADLFRVSQSTGLLVSCDITKPSIPKSLGCLHHAEDIERAPVFDVRSNLDALIALEPKGIWKHVINKAKVVSKGKSSRVGDDLEDALKGSFVGFLEVTAVFNILRHIFSNETLVGSVATWYKGKLGKGDLDIKEMKEILTRAADSSQSRSLIQFTLSSVAFGNQMLSRTQLDQVRQDCYPVLPEVIFCWLRSKGHDFVRETLAFMGDRLGEYEELNWNEVACLGEFL